MVIVRIHKKNGGDTESRTAYYNALERVKTHNDKSEFIRLIANYVKSSLERYIKILGG